MEGRSSPDPAEVEASEEFPILYGLLTAAENDGNVKLKQGNNSNYSSSCTTARYFQGSRRRRMRRPSSETVMEPDSSTTDDLEPLGGIPPETQFHNSSPLLVLRLTATTSNGTSTNRHQFSNPSKRQHQQYQILQSGSSRGVRKTSRSKKPMEHEEPSSTTAEDEDIPVKIRKIINTEATATTESNNMGAYTTGGTLRALLSKDRGSFGESLEQSHTTTNRFNAAAIVGTGTERNIEDESSFGIGRARRLQRIGIDFFPCNNCDLNFTKLHHLELHQSYHTNKKLHKCSQCSVTFYLKKSLLNHESKYHGLRTKDTNGNLLLESSRLVFRQQAGQEQQESYDLTTTTNYNNNFQPFQLPIDLEITKVPDTKNQLLSKLLDMKTSESVYEVSNTRNSRSGKDNIIELLIPKQSSSSSSTDSTGNNNSSSRTYPCGHCEEEYGSLSSLLKHTARTHVPKNGVGGDTFHIEIETRD